MCYCLNPVCQHPQNPNHLTYCRSCGEHLLLKQRYRAECLLDLSTIGPTFLAVDLLPAHKPKCVIKQYLPPPGADRRKKALDLFYQEADRLAELGNHPKIPQLLDAVEQSGYQYLIQEPTISQTTKIVKTGAIIGLCGLIVIGAMMRWVSKFTTAPEAPPIIAVLNQPGSVMLDSNTQIIQSPLDTVRPKYRTKAVKR
jgi:hypothetical protein